MENAKISDREAVGRFMPFLTGWSLKAPLPQRFGVSLRNLRGLRFEWLGILGSVRDGRGGTVFGKFCRIF